MLKAGYGKRSISPPVGAPLAGFAARKDMCAGIHDELYARALVLDNGGTAVALVSLDVLALGADFVDRTRQTVASRRSHSAASHSYRFDTHARRPRNGQHVFQSG